MIDTTGFFNDIFKHAKENSVIIMDLEGNILQVNKAFKNAFKYYDKDVTGKHFRLLFTEKDRLAKKPEKEINDVIRFNSKSDNNYLLTKKGAALWVMGESVMAGNEANERFIVKIIQDIHTQKQLESFLLESREFIDVLFESIKDASLITLDSMLRIIKINKAFIKMFELEKKPEQGSRLNHLNRYSFTSKLFEGGEKEKLVLLVIKEDKGAGK